MVLDEATARELAVFFAKRFPTDADRARLAARAGVADPGDWAALILAADRAGKLGRLVAAANSEAPGDANLREAQRILAPRRSPLPYAVAGFVVVTVLGGAAAWLNEQVRFPPDPEPVAAPAPPAPAVAAASSSPSSPAPAASPEPASVEPASVEPASAEPAGPSAPQAPPVARSPSPVAPSDSPEPVASTAAKPPQPEARSLKPEASVASACGGRGGEIVGYWYAGTEKPGEAGAAIELTHGARVRADYPRADNGHRVDFEVRCVLAAGTRVRLSRAPIETSGHWWVPLAGGDVGG